MRVQASGSGHLFLPDASCQAWLAGHSNLSADISPLAGSSLFETSPIQSHAFSADLGLASSFHVSEAFKPLSSEDSAAEINGDGSAATKEHETQNFSVSMHLGHKTQRVGG